MKVQTESINPVKTKLTVEVDADDFNKQFKAELQSISRKAAIPGFRKGKAPPEIVAKRYPHELDKRWQEGIANRAFQETMGCPGRV